MTEASGSVGGLTASRGFAGSYFRRRAVPVNPRTTRQQSARSAIGALSNRWATLTQGQRDSWNYYASQVQMVNALGATFYASGFNHYCRSNSVRIGFVGDDKIVDDGPTIYNKGSTPDVQAGAYVVSVGGVLTLAPDCFLADALVTPHADSRILEFVTGPLSPTVGWYKGPYHFVGEEAVLGSASQPQTLDFDSDIPFLPAGGEQVGFKLVVSRNDGRLTGTFYGRVLTTAAP